MTKEDKEALINAFKMVDVKKMDIDHDNKHYQKWFRFGNYNAMLIATEIVKQMPEKKSVKKEQTA